NYNLLNKNNFPKIYATLNDTLKKNEKIRNCATKLHKSLTNKELKIILNYNIMSSNELEELLKRVFYGFVFEGKYHDLLIDQFEDTKKGLVIKKFQQKNDQEELESN
ncbi:13783_t:CDS:1, partial [Funneliformis geosporum]